MPTPEEKKEKDRFPIFQERFNKLRGELSQDEFAKKIGISRPTVGFYENGERLPDALILRRIAEKCNTSVNWLLGLTDIETGNADDVAIEKRFGLDKEAISNLESGYSNIPSYKEIANKIIGDKEFKNLVSYICVLIDTEKRYALNPETQNFTNHTVASVIASFRTPQEYREFILSPEEILSARSHRVEKTFRELLDNIISQELEGIKNGNP